MTEGRVRPGRRGVGRGGDACLSVESDGQIRRGWSMGGGPLRVACIRSAASGRVLLRGTR